MVTWEIWTIIGIYATLYVLTLILIMKSKRKKEG